jgi:NAD(P)H-dependent flavin oxidoreductase YrpB (nitropropane dioxygenase family)
MMNAEAVEWEIRQVRDRTGGPVAANVLLPLARSAHWKAASTADVVVTFWGHPKRMTSKPWWHQCGSVDEALEAQRAGADAVIVQGVEAGGHVRGTEPALVLLERARAALPRGYPVLSSGGIATANDVRERLDAGAVAAVVGTRFVMTEECPAHTGYKQRLLEARETVLTELFGVGWPGPHRVIWNEATERWLARDPRGPVLVRLANRLTGSLAARTPESLQQRLLQRQSVSFPFLSPQPVTREMPSRLLDVTPLYAGESVARIHDIKPASDAVIELSPAGYG